MFFLGLDAESMLLIYLFLVLFLGPLTFQLVKSLEDRHPVLLVTSLKHPILVLGGGYTPNVDLPFNQQLTMGSLGSLMEGIRILKQSGSNLLVLSGSSLVDGWLSLSYIQSIIAEEYCCVDRAQIIHLFHPTDTKQEALAYFEIFGTIRPVLVTKAIHMPRALLTFYSLGIRPVPAPCNFIFKHDRLSAKHFIFPSFSHIPYIGELLKELWGLLFLKMSLLSFKKIRTESA